MSTGVRLNSVDAIGCVYCTIAEDIGDCQLPTLIHLSAKFGLQELCAKLTDLPDAEHAVTVADEVGRLPQDIARINKHADLAEFLATFQETVSGRAYIYIHIYI